jgi:hypothetical protein
MDKLKLTGRNLGQAFNSRCGHACLCHAILLITKTAKLKVENLSKTTFRFSLISFSTPRLKVRLHWRDFARDFALACTFCKENK